ncbi:cation:proton antiporter [Vitiosangium sp. GDMCC 1.1324]|uniref:cation:proton antiporter domain-containing protein n=1 Tax=Vitiosangium sp. (strain GDMCC 1.1324) TaxID=2138576 RepID=UPI000D3C032D|nr:cation:proton antiporter [Vitiosangium sp. GDMCC 1.1324]PTL85281.1 cation/H(+) antiporter [Vitiosangium sp. GDMCC 1.1324]
MHALAHNALTLLIVQFLVIMGASRLIGRGARWLGQPMVIAEVLAGILLGPSLLGWLAPGAMEWLFPNSSMPVLKMLSQVGLILFMFLIGLELDPRLLKGKGHSSVAISHTSIIVPFALGAAAALWFYPRLSDPSVPFSSFVLFMGVSMSITAFPVLARILTEKRLLRSKVGAIAITCAAVDDVTAWCLLAFVVSIVRATSLMEAGLTTLLALLYIGFMMGLVRPFLARLGARVASKDGLTQNVVALTLMMLLASSWAAELIGIHALFGAFMMGAVIPKEGGLAEALAEKLEDVAVVLLLPLFFAFSGLRTQVGLLNSAEAWLMCGLIILLACLGKFGGSAVAARLTGLRWREAGAVGVLMNTRGLMELIVLNIGLDLGVISPTLFTMMVVMALVTTFMTTPLLRWIYPPEELAREQVSLEPVAPLPNAEPFTVLMCVSHGQAGAAMVTLGRALTNSPAEPSQLYALHLIPPTERASFHLRHDPEKASGSTLAPMLGRASSLGLELRPLSFVSAEPGLDICRTAEAKRADLILLGWHKPLFSQTMLGGTVHEVMSEAATDVAVLVDRGLENIRRVLVPFIGSQHDRAALGLARRLLQQGQVEITLLHVSSGAHGRTGARTRVEELFPEGSGRVRFKVVEHESPEDAALEEARSGYDLVVVGVGTEWGLEERLFGLHRERIIREASASVLVVRHPAPTPAAESLSTPEAPGELPAGGAVT